MTALRDLICATGALAERWICTADGDFSLDEIISSSWVDAPVDQLRGRSILIATDEQFATACALIACDGLARRIIFCPPGLSAEHVAELAARAEVDVVLCDDPAARNPIPSLKAFAVRPHPISEATTHPASGFEAVNRGHSEQATEWILPTSGTSGTPKLVIHTLQTLIGAIIGSSLEGAPVWGTFYDIRRYGGLQIFLRAMIGGGTMVLSSGTESIEAFITRAGRNGVTHISGTPTHWRLALMSRSCMEFAPQYLRLSGEIADQSILDRLRKAFPDAAISHAFASTEAGVAFDVGDGLAGFPANLLVGGDRVALRIKDGTLQIRSDRIALRYLGDAASAISDSDGFVDTGDMVELHRHRYLFVGRRNGIINVGGLKIHPEEIEAVILDHPRVQMCVVSARKNPITGALVTADVVADLHHRSAEAKALRDEILSLCRHRLVRHKVPASVKLVSSLDIAVSGKVRR